MKRSDIVLLLLYPFTNNEGAIVGTTRLQKLLFLLEKEGGVDPKLTQFNFVPYKFGPASKRLYDDLEFLTGLGLIERSDHKPFEIEKGPEDIDAISADDLLSEREESDDPRSLEQIPADSTVYRIAEKGLEHLRTNQLVNSDQFRAAEKVKRKFSRYSLTELLRYVYSKYPDYTVESEIKERFNG
jgi:uncharacterized protein YwgA